MPALIANHRKQEVTTKLKKIYSVMNQAISKSVTEYGDIETWAIDCGVSGTPTCTMDEAIERFNEYIGKNLQITDIKKDIDIFYVYLSDGTILAVNNGLIDMEFYINQKALDNRKRGVNSFQFRFNPVLSTGQDENKNKYSLKAAFEPYAWNWDGTRDGLFKTGNRYGCGEDKNLNVYCTKLIQYEGWQIPKDYPLRF